MEDASTVFENIGVQEHVERQFEAMQERLERQRFLELGTTIPRNKRNKLY